MARTVNRNQTLEEFRSIHNDLAGDVGSITGLAGTISNGNNLVDAINELENKTFFFQTFEYVATASQTTFSGADANSNVMSRIMMPQSSPASVPRLQRPAAPVDGRRRPSPGTSIPTDGSRGVR